MRFFYDTEFLEDGKSIRLISIGVVREDGKTFYAVNKGMPLDEIMRNDWLYKNVIPHLPITWSPYQGRWAFEESHKRTLSLLDIRRELEAFLGVSTHYKEGSEPIELWADYGAYDHVVLCQQIWGSMIQLPPGMPMFTNDLQQLYRTVLMMCPEVEDIPHPDDDEPWNISDFKRPHHALEDAQRVAEKFDYYNDLLKQSLK